ncbi:dTDP-glucose 4,6-dehydratase [Sandaracinus amylolyticus]|uniref:UDP-glucose 4-epimerase n=1 Tax=Sandaracinus amylolyticus TaxID=927083 RepID=A0A0F6W4D6_9BACT|nr:GDP-mannose 4,6-dehydratase [Sandaracinus amylolyticus]AKF06990.1 UDP-glucose 4-epimerase [Sandaracinus amylolyticus]
MRCLITGGAGFIGRWVVQRLLDDGHEVLALDDLSNGRRENLREFEGRSGFAGLVHGDLADPETLARVFQRGPWDLVLHLGASIHVQKSIDDPYPTFRNDVEGTFRVLEACRREYFARNGLDVDARQFDFDRDVPRLRDRRPRVVVMSTCMVYATSSMPIVETHPFRPASPYAASKIASDHLALSYFHAYRLPVTVVRPFNTYGPFQKSNGEGGVVSIFLQRDLAGKPLLVKGTGEQTRDLLYVEDCADFVVRAATSDAAEGQVINAGTGRDIAVRDLAELCRTGSNVVERVPHDHPQAEIMRLCTDASKAKQLLGWEPTTSLEEGLRRTRAWLDSNRWAW